MNNMPPSFKETIKKTVPQLISGLTACCNCPFATHADRGLTLSGQKSIHEILKNLVSILFPGCHGRESVQRDDLADYLEQQLAAAVEKLSLHIERALEYQCTFVDCKDDCSQCGDQAEQAISGFLKGLPQIQSQLQSDIQAAYEGDPAARSTMEIVMSYPGFLAITVHRIAHLFYNQSIPLIPRVMSEYAHAQTGIDIHPGATIGEGFFIDHGTGVVIGETAVIGKHVKLYQGVTLGAKSFEKDAQGRPVKGIKRHPNVEDHVVIYAGATILGGNTTIGAHSEIGGNVWLTHSIPPHSKVYNQQPAPLISRHNGNDEAEAPEE